jgi:chaperonin GroES
MAERDDDNQGEMIDLPDEDSDVEDTDDGGALVTIDESPTRAESEFYANLAETMPSYELANLGSTLCDIIEKDKEARKRRDEQYEEGIRRTGLGDDAPGGASFTGASKVVHPMLTQACVDFAARVMKEMFPPDGPAREKIVGEPTLDKVEKAGRITKYTNWQLTEQMPEFRAELEQLVTQLPLGGGQYLKMTWDGNRKRPMPMFVPIDDVYLPFAATNFYTAERKTHVQYITRIEYEKRVLAGDYLDVDLRVDPMPPEESKASRANDKVEGRQSDGYNIDGLRTIYECYIIQDLDNGDGIAPYVISIDKNTQRILSIYRNWEEDDETKDEMQWLVEFPFVPWRGAYPIGLIHMIGGLSAGATGALRALLDSAHINNFPGLLKLKSGAGGQTDRVDPTEVKEIEGTFGQDDIRKVLMAMPYNPPSPVLFQLLGFLVDASQNVVRTTFEEFADSNANTPVGTTLARLEQGMVVFSAIHARMHDAMARVLKLLFRLNRTYLEEAQVVDETGELLVKRSDFEGPMNVIPVSDPNIFSEAQRFAQIQAVMQRAKEMPQLYDLRKVEEMFLVRLKIPQGKELLLPKQQPLELNAVNENIAATMKRPIVAFPEQDHLAHLQVHLDFVTNPMFGGNRVIGPQCVPLLLDHIKEHMVLWYANQIFNEASDAAQVDIGEIQKGATTEEKKSLDQMLAATSQVVSKQAEETFSSIPQIIQTAIETLQAMMPPPQMPADPRVEVMKQQVEAQAAKDQADAQYKQTKLQQDAQIKAQEAQMRSQEKMQDIQARLAMLQEELKKEMLRQEAEDRRVQAQIQARLEMNESDNQTAKQLAALEVATGERIGVSTGTGINPNPRS